MIHMEAKDFITSMKAFEDLLGQVPEAERAAIVETLRAALDGMRFDIPSSDESSAANLIR